VVSFAVAALVVPQSAFSASDPGVRGGAAGAGGELAGLSTGEAAFFDEGLDAFNEVDGVGDGLGPRFNLDSCGGCHAQPAVGGSAPGVNPQVALATAFGAKNTVPSFITANGPVREARFKRLANGQPDGGVHALYVISGRVDSTGDASGCNAVQENFATAVSNNNVIFRIPTPTFGAGLIELIPDGALNDNLGNNANTKANLGISGRLNHSGNDGTVTRFGWKAQNKSLMIFAGEAYNVEQGISNELFQTERDENPTCQFKLRPNDASHPDEAAPLDVLNDVEKFAFFMRFLAAPTPSTTSPGGSTSINNGRNVFTNIGCALCHTPSFTSSVIATTPALRNKPVNLFSDLAIHNMGPGLADEVSQGAAGGDEFRTAPLWGVGKRIFFLHDGRTSDIQAAIRAHRSSANGTFPASEANQVINNYDNLFDFQRQDILNFLRSL
jgi:CxxC motif-containing protein (DUF1111 family)